MSPKQLNQVIAGVAIALIAIIFILLAANVINGIFAIVLTLGVGAGARVARSRLIKP